MSYNDLWRHRDVDRAIAASVKSVTQLHPSVDADGVRALVDSLHAGVELAFPPDESPTT